MHNRQIQLPVVFADVVVFQVVPKIAPIWERCAHIASKEIVVENREIRWRPIKSPWKAMTDCGLVLMQNRGAKKLAIIALQDLPSAVGVLMMPSCPCAARTPSKPGLLALITGRHAPEVLSELRKVAPGGVVITDVTMGDFWPQVFAGLEQAHQRYVVVGALPCGHMGTHPCCTQWCPPPPPCPSLPLVLPRGGGGGASLAQSKITSIFRCSSLCCCGKTTTQECCPKLSSGKWWACARVQGQVEQDEENLH